MNKVPIFIHLRGLGSPNCNWLADFFPVCSFFKHNNKNNYYNTVYIHIIYMYTVYCIILRNCNGVFG